MMLTEQLKEAVSQGRVRMQVHPVCPDLKIYNYTEEVQFGKTWDALTLSCRGLIVRDDGTVIARPWDKFFNYSETPDAIPLSADVEVADKMDGSLGILYTDSDGITAIATRGSFTSDQAVRATYILRLKYPEIACKTFPDVTYLFEIIYPENRIVCDYGDMEDLVLLGARDIEHGWNFGAKVAAWMLGWEGPVVETFKYPTLADVLRAPMRPGKEGLVVRHADTILKIKQPDYIELHKLLSDLNDKAIWELLKTKTVEEICVNLPDEFHDYVAQVAEDLGVKAVEIENSAVKAFEYITFALPQDLAPEVYRREFARWATQSSNPHLLFSLLDNKPISAKIWDMVKPKGDKP